MKNQFPVKYTNLEINLDEMNRRLAIQAELNKEQALYDALASVRKAAFQNLIDIIRNTNAR